MNVNQYDEADFNDDSYFDNAISAVEIDAGNNSTSKKTPKQKLKIKRRLDSLHEKRKLARATNTLYDDWEH